MILESIHLGLHLEGTYLFCTLSEANPTSKGNCPSPGNSPSNGMRCANAWLVHWDRWVPIRHLATPRIWVITTGSREGCFFMFFPLMFRIIYPKSYETLHGFLSGFSIAGFLILYVRPNWTKLPPKSCCLCFCPGRVLLRLVGLLLHDLCCMCLVF